MSYLASHLQQIGALTLQHLALVFSSLGLALVMALPLGIYAARVPRASALLFGLLGAIYVIPSLAALAILVRYGGLGAIPVIVVLVAYAQFILVRNIAAALRAVPLP